MRIIRTKRGFEFSFAWLFAFLAGAVILFLAIYFSSQLIETGRYEVDTKTAKQLSILFDPMETGIASAKSSSVKIDRDTRFYIGCDNKGDFGNFKLSASSMSFGKWSSPSLNITANNKYVFAEKTVQGKEYFFISKPFEFPFKISEIIIIYDKEYCFINADDIEEDIIGKIKTENCSSNSVKVCFDTQGCNITVHGLCERRFGYCDSDYDYGYVEKNGKRMYYEGNLLYGAIFSSPEVYECNVKRLMKRLSHISRLYEEEAGFLEMSSMQGEFLALASLAGSVDDSESLSMLREQARIIDAKNEDLGGRGFY